MILEEESVPYNIMLEIDKINNDFSDTDIILVISANNTVNPIALNPGGPITSIPVLYT